MNSVSEAIAAISSATNESELYEALTFLANNVDKLTQRVFFELPGGLSGNGDDTWEFIKAQSEARCGCGNERVFNPTTVRSTFVPGPEEITLGLDDAVYIKPIGGNKQSTVVRFQVAMANGETALTMLPDPFAPLVLTLDLFSTKGYLLSQLADAISKSDAAEYFPMFGYEKSGPVCWFKSCDPENNTITLVIDEAMETFRKDDNVADGHSH